ncbi:hypothetical protein CASFOL_009168 [Castilleja foliolosa]|uniref:CAF-1 p60 homolog n=1 Tax=Castilleja foliolosa TaxID=1961234 RepID=A0ABD3DYX3_9LAMI
MRGGTVQINWHETKPVLACDFHPLSGLLATGGADYDIKLWSTVSGIGENKSPGVIYHNNLSYHSSAVNALRFSPSGEQLASGADGGELILWKSHTTDAGEVWKVLKSLVFHRKDVLDLQWSTDGAYLISGSVDNSCIIWDANKGSVHQILDGHFHYVQGVAWDPLGTYAASLSSDRTCRIYFNKPTKMKGIEKENYVCQHVISKAESLTTDESKSSRSHLFLDETLPSFYRRLAWSADGSFLLVPAGFTQKHTYIRTSQHCLCFFKKRSFQARTYASWCQQTCRSSASFFNLPYRYIFAVATLNSLYVYDTESIQPIVIVAGVHYASITDIAWSPAGNYLALSSQDGYCTLLEFENQELGSRVFVPVEEKKVMSDANKSSIPEVIITDNSHCVFVESRNEVVENVLKDEDDNKDEREDDAPITSAPPSETGKRRITPMAID